MDWSVLLAQATINGLIVGLLYLLMAVGFTLVFIWLVLHLQRTMLLVDVANNQGLDAAIVARRAERSAN